MKIALPSIGNQVDGHFGHCQFFTIFEIDDNKIVSQSRLDPPAGCGCKSNVASIMADMGVKVLLAGGMGAGAVRVLNQNGIEVVRGCAGDLREVAEAWLAGRIKDGGGVCDHHDGCGEHHHHDHGGCDHH